MNPRPIVVAHRGASGYLPEHTAEAKALAYGQGADYLEQDVVATRDGALLVLHDIYLERVTDVALRFPGRCRDDGRYYAIDFTLDEVRTLRVGERLNASMDLPLFPARFPVGRGSFRISTLAEEIDLVQGLNISTGRRVGIYPEIKDPQWHARHGIDLSGLVIAELARYGYRLPSDLAFVQCFDVQELRRIRTEFSTELPLVQLLDERPEHAACFTPAGLRSVAEYANAIGPPLMRLIEPHASGGLVPSRLVDDARAAGLLIHPYTFRRERLPAFAASLEELLRLYLRAIPVDGVFCDFPDVAFAIREELRGAS